MEGKKPFSFTKWAKSRKGQQVIICVAFMTIPLLLLFVFTYLPFAEMVKFSFYKMKYLTPVDQRKFVGFKNYIDVFRRDDCFGALKLSLYYMVGAIIQLVLALYLATILSFKVKGGNFFKGLMFFPYLISGALVIVIFCLNFFFRLVDVKGTSMVETLQNGDKLIVTNFNYTPKPNDIIVISHGKEYAEPIVKRVIATAGQTLKLDYENDRILVDGVVIDEPYLDVSTFCNVEADYEIPEVIPDGMIFVMGDNRGVSMDSRDSRIGLISVDNVIGKAQFVVYPFSDFKYLY